MVSQRVITQHHGVATISELKEIENTFLRHQPHNEIQRRLVILHAVLTRCVATFEAINEFYAEGLQHRFNNLYGALVLIDAPIA